MANIEQQSLTIWSHWLVRLITSWKRRTWWEFWLHSWSSRCARPWWSSWWSRTAAPQAQPRSKSHPIWFRQRSCINKMTSISFLCSVQTLFNRNFFPNLLHLINPILSIYGYWWDFFSLKFSISSFRKLSPLSEFKVNLLWPLGPAKV